MTHSLTTPPKNDICHFKQREKNSFERQSIVSTEFCCSLLHFPGDTGVATTQISADFHSAALFRPCFYKEF